MVSPQPAPPINATGLPPGVEVGGLGKRFLAHLIDRLVLVLLAVAAVYLAPRVGGDTASSSRLRRPCSRWPGCCSSGGPSPNAQPVPACG